MKLNKKDIYLVNIGMARKFIIEGRLLSRNQNSISFEVQRDNGVWKKGATVGCWIYGKRTAETYVIGKLSLENE